MLKTASGEITPYQKALRQLRRTFVVVGLFSAAINLLMLTGPLYMLQVYDRVLSSGSVATLQGLFVIVVVLYVFLGIYEFLRSRLLSRASYRLDDAVGQKAFGYHLQTGIEQTRAMHNPARDLGIVRGFLAGPAIRGLFDLPWMPLFLAVVFFIHPWLGWLTSAGAVIIIVAALLNQMSTRQPISTAMELDAVERNFLERCRRNAEAILALGMQQKIVQRWNELHHRSLAHSQQGGDRSEAYSAFSKAFRLLLQSMLLTLGAFLAIRQEISAGSIVATSIIAGRALSPVDQVIGQWRSIARARESQKNLRAAFETLPPEKKHIRLPDPKGLLNVRRVTKVTPAHLRTAERSKILDQVSFTLNPGDGLGVIGNSAAGKSSLARILVGAWQPDIGEVRLDGALLHQWHPDDLGRHIGYLPQMLEMLPGTIAENIARFEAKARDAEVIEAAKIAGVHEMILALPDGYSTQIGTVAQPLSGGQMQRLGLARAIFGIPRLIVLDEPNSNLDNSGDDALAKAISTLREKGCVVVVMAHRPSVINAVNKVLILDKGKVAHFDSREAIFNLAMRSVDRRVQQAG